MILRAAVMPQKSLFTHGTAHLLVGKTVKVRLMSHGQMFTVRVKITSVSGRDNKRVEGIIADPSSFTEQLGYKPENANFLAMIQPGNSKHLGYAEIAPNP